jgi:uncharacterized protein
MSSRIVMVRRVITAHWADRHLAAARVVTPRPSVLHCNTSFLGVKPCPDRRRRFLVAGPLTRPHNEHMLITKPGKPTTMSRPHKCRLIASEPPVSAFKPAGVPGRDLESIELGLDELEALRLADLEGLYYEAAAERMGISRQTFGRLIECARHKVACALFQSKMLVFRGGPIVMATMRTFACVDCQAHFELPHGTGRPTECPSCHGRNFHRMAEARGRGRRAGATDGAGRGCCRRRRAGWSKLSQPSVGMPAEHTAEKTEIHRKENAE